MDQEEFSHRMRLAYLHRTAYMDAARTSRSFCGPNAPATMRHVDAARRTNHHILWLRREARRAQQRDRHPLDRLIRFIQRAL